MAGTYQLTSVVALPPPNVQTFEENETISTHYQAHSEKPVKAGCCSHVRKHPKGNASPNALVKKATKAQMKLYLRYTWIDALILAIFGLIILGLYWAPNNLRNSPLLPIWPAVAMDGTVVPGRFLDLRAPAEYEYPWQKSPLNDFVCALIITLVPILMIALFQIKVRSTWDFHAGHVGILRAVTTT
jgi:diacylglycerol diphosphate phosphatase/phosphatidate phosphatase